LRFVTCLGHLRTFSPGAIKEIRAAEIHEGNWVRIVLLRLFAPF
jgi:hypothetical protein